jgi:pimeloyl-ACP methyl ester carboxylesterase
MALAACGGGSSNQSQTFDSLVLFDPVPAASGDSAIIPFPFDGLFSGFTAPTLNIPGLPAPLSDANLQDGFSTTGSIFADVAGQLDYSTVPANILIVNSATGAMLVPGVDFTVENENATATDPLSGAQTPISSQRSRLLISPLKPLAASTRYLVALTAGMKTLQGGSVIASDAFNITSSSTPVSQQSDPSLAQYSAAQKAQLEALRSQLILPVVQAFVAAGVPAKQIVLAWSFTTESIADSLNVVAQNATAGSIAVANTTETTTATGGYGFADIYAGVTTLPYYLQAPSTGNPTAPLSDYWLADASKPTSGSFLGQVPCGAFAEGATVNGVTLTPSVSTTACFPVPVAQSTQTVPVLVTVPDSKATGLSKPAAGWPVVIFQHGITRSREDMFAVADGLARAGFVVVAIDLPLHGVTNTADPFYQNQLFAGTPAAGLKTGERTFNLDLENNATGAPGPDGVIDPSGTWFINLQSLVTSRDNLREGVADLITLGKTVATLNLEGGGATDINPSRIYYFGHSLGGIVGGTLLGVDTDIGAAVLANPGGGVAKLLDASATFGPIIAAGLGAAGVEQGSDNYDTFLRFAQTLVDSGDPINYAAAARAGHAIDLIEVIGDLVVPNAAPSTCVSPLPAGIASTAALLAACPATATQDITVEPGYLSGTDPLVAAMGLKVIGPLTVPVSTPDVITGSDLGYAVQFAQGSHSTVLDPTADPQETVEMQTEAAQFLASGGQCLAVGGSCP